MLSFEIHIQYLSLGKDKTNAKTDFENRYELYIIEYYNVAQSQVENNTPTGKAFKQCLGGAPLKDDQKKNN